MTATEIMPLLVNASQSYVTALSNAEVFDGLSFLSAMIGLFALSIILDLIHWIRSRGYGNE